jgi:hypothetical protein
MGMGFVVVVDLSCGESPTAVEPAALAVRVLCFAMQNQTAIAMRSNTYRAVAWGK